MATPKLQIDWANASIVTQVLELFSRLFGKSAAEIPTNVSLIELGVDSLFLLQASQMIKAEFGVKVPFRLLLEDLSTIEAIAAHLHEKRPNGFEQKAPVATPAPVNPPASVSPVVSPQVRVDPTPSPAPVARVVAPAPAAAPAVNFQQAIVFPASPELDYLTGPNIGTSFNLTSIEHIIAQQLRLGEEQLRLMSLQLELLHENRHEPVIPIVSEPESVTLPQTSVTSGNSGEPTTASQPEPETFVAHKPLDKKAGALDDRQRAHLDGLIARLNARTSGSKRLAQQNRPFLANKRAIAGYRQLWKELMYPLVIERAQGSRVWDVDGNEYVDMTMGFGALLFGHSPQFIIDALKEQLDKGLQIGGHTPLTGEVASLICELTGVERVAFCNSGTEAVMGALRLARTVTGRDKIALFDGCYHGTFDGIMVRGEVTAGNRLRALPMAPGVPQKMIDDVLLLRYDDPQSIEILKEHAHELAAVLIEPPRSRRPDIQPRHFLHELRSLTEEAGAALIFDEVVTGFRFHPGGAQAMFDIRADLVTYGKAMGGGVPVAVIAGKAAYMDAVDGGMWNYGDASFPEADITFMTGTYFQHPVMMAALRAALMHIKEQGPRLQEDLATKTAYIAETLNTYFKEQRVPLSTVYMGSLFRLLYPSNLRDMDLFFYHLLEKGVFVCETRTCLLSTAHTDRDIDHVIRAFKETTEEMLEGGFLTRVSPEPPDGGDRARETVGPNTAMQRIPLTEGQKEIWALANMGDEGARAYNQSLAVHLRGALNAPDLEAALRQVLARHQALRSTFNPDGDYQTIATTLEFKLELSDLSRLDVDQRAAEQARLQAAEANQSFDLARGPLLRMRLLKLSDVHHVLVITMHHLICDGWSIGIILSELAELYAAKRQGREAQLSSPHSFVEYANKQFARQQSSEMQDAESYWLSQFAGPLPSLNLPTVYPRLAVQTYAGAQRRLLMNADVYPALKRLSTQQGCTMFMTLLTAFKVLLNHLTDQNDIIVGIPAAGQLNAEAHKLVGYCVNMLPLRSQVTPEMKFVEYLKTLKQIMADAYDYQDYPYGKLLKKLNVKRDPSRSPLVEAVFNVDQSVSGQKFFDLDMEVKPNHNLSSKFDLTMDVTEGPGELVLDCEYNTNLFSEGATRVWMVQYESVLSTVAARPDISIAEVREALREVERHDRENRARQLQEAQRSKFSSIKRRAVAS
ncbi:MAG: amino acid adenylation domain protein [Acidobacteria bacterium]|nr:amino acid adenylation domain protein [Acidobacteriota bacterium]